MWERQKSVGGFGHLTGAHVDSFEMGLEQSEELDALQQQLRLAEVSKAEAAVATNQQRSPVCGRRQDNVLIECHMHCNCRAAARMLLLNKQDACRLRCHLCCACVLSMAIPACDQSPIILGLLLQELLRKHGLMQTYNSKLATAAGGDSTAQVSTHSQPGQLAATTAAFCGCLCCAAGDRNSTEEVETASKPQPKPFKTQVSPVALLLVLGYMAATGFYLYSRASRIRDLGPQWW
jgi:hypothetical protein